jgi:RNA polymerase sigma-70 factor (ECF subfamily)
MSVSVKREPSLDFEHLVTPHLDALLRTAQRLTASSVDAEDLVQETLLKGYRFFGRFEEGTNFKAWIFKILMNAFVNTYRARRRQKFATEGEFDEEWGDPKANQPQVDAETFSARERAALETVDDRIKQALIELPESLRIVFMLSTLEDLKYREIADILDCPVGTVMSRLFRARAMLKERLRQFAEETGIKAGEDDRG